jgi:RNA polymerase-binding transcription factor DksA
MTEGQLQHLERRLHEERNHVTKSLSRSQRELSSTQREQDGSLTAYPLHIADLGSDSNEREVAFSLANRQTEVLHEIDAALERLHNDPEAFGMCDGCGSAIPFERLDLVPWAHECDDEGAPSI